MFYLKIYMQICALLLIYNLPVCHDLSEPVQMTVPCSKYKECLFSVEADPRFVKEQRNGDMVVHIVPENIGNFFGRNHGNGLDFYKLEITSSNGCLITREVTINITINGAETAETISDKFISAEKDSTPFTVVSHCESVSRDPQVPNNDAARQEKKLDVILILLVFVILFCFIISGLLVLVWHSAGHSYSRNWFICRSDRQEPDRENSSRRRESHQNLIVAESEMVVLMQDKIDKKDDLNPENSINLTSVCVDGSAIPDATHHGNEGTAREVADVYV